MGSSLPRPDSPVLGVLTTWQGEWGPLRGEWGLSPLFLFSVFFSSPSHTQTTHPESCCSDRFPFVLPAILYSISVSFSGLPHCPSPPHLSALESVEKPALPDQRCQNWGHNFWTEDMGHEPCASPPPAPPDGFITSYAAHLKPIESLGGRECLTQISTSEGVSATLGNY